MILNVKQKYPILFITNAYNVHDARVLVNSTKNVTNIIFGEIVWNDNIFQYYVLNNKLLKIVFIY